MTEVEERAAKAWCDLVEAASRTLEINWFCMWLNAVGEGSDMVRTTKGLALLPVIEQLERKEMQKRAESRKTQRRSVRRADGQWQGIEKSR